MTTFNILPLYILSVNTFLLKTKGIPQIPLYIEKLSSDAFI